MKETEPLNLTVTLPKRQKADAPGGGWHFKQDFPHEWCWFADAFTPMELDAIIRIGEQIEMDKGRLYPSTSGASGS